VYWLEGACVSSSENDPDTGKWFFLYLLILLVMGVVAAHLDRTALKDLQVMYHLRRTLRQLLPSYIPLTHDLAAFTLRSSIAMATFLAIVTIFLKQTANFYEDERGYDTGRAYSFSLGFAALFCAGLTIIPVNKTGIIVTLFRIPFDRATKFHRICGALTMLLVMVHAIQIVDFWGQSEVISLDTAKKVGDEAYPAYGLLAACCFGAMALTAPHPMRSRCYELFQLAHCLFLPAMVLIMLHVPKPGMILIAPLALYALDVVYRLYQQFLPVENVSISSPYSKYTVLKVKAKHVEDIKPGQFCMVNIASASFFQWHPISICSYDRETHELTFIVKNVGDWTANICNVVNSTDSTAILDKFKVRLRGPYGRIRFDLGADGSGLYRYEKLILVAGGIGCTPMISTLQWLIDDANEHRNKHCLHVTVLITARDREMFSLFGEFFKIFNASDVFQKGGIDLRLYCTTSQRSYNEVAGPNSLEIQTIRSSEVGTTDFMGSVANLSVPITYARPDLGKEINTVCECREDSGGRVCVLVCGPAGIVTAVQKGCYSAVKKFGPVLDLHEESFRL
jgi:predicted ferric reductase